MYCKWVWHFLYHIHCWSRISLALLWCLAADCGVPSIPRQQAWRACQGAGKPIPKKKPRAPFCSFPRSKEEIKRLKVAAAVDARNKGPASRLAVRDYNVGGVSRWRLCSILGLGTASRGRVHELNATCNDTEQWSNDGGHQQLLYLWPGWLQRRQDDGHLWPG